MVIANPFNSWEPLTSNVEGNHELSLEIGKCNDYLEREYNQVIGNGGHLQY